jgi:hypothetical protein
MASAEKPTRWISMLSARLGFPYNGSHSNYYRVMYRIRILQFLGLSVGSFHLQVQPKGLGKPFLHFFFLLDNLLTFLKTHVNVPSVR